MHLLVDSTGLKLCGSGEWLLEEHGTQTRRSWRKLHIGMDANTGRILAAMLTTSDVDDASQVGPLLDQIMDPVASFTADAAYDQDGVYGNVTARHPNAAVIVGALTLQRVSKQQGRDGPQPARPAPARHRRAWSDELAEGVRLSLACAGGGRRKPVQASDR
ncbi:MAG: transposase, partial [Janthinobacterium lividum]